jgi:hypothetical protein
MIVGNLPLHLIANSLFAIVTYFMVGLAMDVSKFLIFLLVTNLLAYASLALGHFVSVVSPNLEVQRSIA